MVLTVASKPVLFSLDLQWPKISCSKLHKLEPSGKLQRHYVSSTHLITYAVIQFRLHGKHSSLVVQWIKKLGKGRGDPH